MPGFVWWRAKNLFHSDRINKLFFLTFFHQKTISLTTTWSVPAISKGLICKDSLSTWDYHAFALIADTINALKPIHANLKSAPRPVAGPAMIFAIFEQLQLWKAIFSLDKEFGSNLKKYLEQSTRWFAQWKNVLLISLLLITVRLVVVSFADTIYPTPSLHGSPLLTLVGNWCITKFCSCPAERCYLLSPAAGNMEWLFLSLHATCNSDDLQNLPYCEYLANRDTVNFPWFKYWTR